ncbi:MAG: PP2C family serine/threonine-protein phosphatase [Myxococcota bacterium]|nr:PP2C family serine/threonine-protein phosphatase [Myxococcota bacterium]
MEWKCCGASVMGSYHREGGIACQDAHAIRVGAAGDLALVVADGAGSASHSALGAELLCQRVADALIGCPEAPVEAVAEAVEIAIEELRGELSSPGPETGESSEGEATPGLRDYAATLVACCLRPSGGVFVHIGDGAAIAMDSQAGEAQLISPPENGEYANETFFFTMPSWREHLRVTSCGEEIDTVFLVSDGVTPLAVGKDGMPFMPFVQPLHDHLVGWERGEGERRVAATLGSEQVDRITGDDRTLVWATRAMGG